MTDVAPAETVAEPAAEAETPLSFEELEATYDKLEADPSTPDASKAEIKKLRAEHKRYREAYDPYKTAFDGIPDGDRDAILGLATLAKSGDLQGIHEWLSGNAKTIATRLGITVKEAKELKADVKDAIEAEPDPDEIDFNDPAAVKAFIAEQISQGITTSTTELTAKQQKEAAEAKAREEIEEVLKELGYESPSAPSARAVLYGAQELGGDPIESIRKAHEARVEELEAEAQKYAAKKLADAGKAAPMNGQAVQAEAPEPDTNLPYSAKVRSRIEARLEGMQGGKQPLA